MGPPRMAKVWSPVAGLAQRPAILQPAHPLPSLEADLQSRSRIFAFYLGLLFVFVRFSMLQHILAYELNVNPYLLYVVGIPTLMGVLATVVCAGPCSAGRRSIGWPSRCMEPLPLCSVFGKAVRWLPYRPTCARN